MQSSYSLNWALLVLALLMEPLVQSQRIKQGCYDAAPITCQAPAETAPTSLDPSSLSIDAEEVCTRLIVEVFPTQDIMLDTTQHPEYLNALQASDEFCQQIRQVYSRCIFCAQDVDVFVEDCYIYTQWTQCGGLPSRQEVLEDFEDPVHARYVTDEDIDNTCAKLQAAYAEEQLLKDWGIGIPSTIDLCHEQVVIKQFCRGYCEGGCFDGPTGTPPSCDTYTGPIDESIRDWRVCVDLDYNHLLWITLFGDYENIYNTSLHADYLRSIPGNSTQCAAAQQSYSQCYWCATDLCYDEEFPATCEAPAISDDELIELSELELEQVCFSLYSFLYFIDEDTSDFYNASLHTDLLPFGRNTTFCELARQNYHKCFFCHQTEYVENFCQAGTWCNSNVTIPDDYVLPESYQAFNLSDANSERTNCSAIHDWFEENFVDAYTRPSCYAHIWLHRQCPREFCKVEPPRRIDPDYLGANTEAQKKALVWASRVSAILSFLGAAYILQDIGRTRKKRENVYYQLLVPIAIFDLVTAFAWCLASAPLDEQGEAFYVYGAHGTEATCTAQAFFVQLGYTSIFYNVSLSIYYVLTIAKGWREFQLKEIRWYLHGFPLLLGIGLALGGLSSYHWMEYGCHLLPRPDGEMWPILLFAVCPLGLSIVSITASMFVVYRAVRLQAAKAKKWRFKAGSSAADTMEQEVFWQCVFYVLAFYVTWPIMFSVYLASVDVKGPLGLTMTVAFVAPLQGFSNSLVYLRPKLKQVLGSFSIKFSFMRLIGNGQKTSAADPTSRCSSVPVSNVSSVVDELNDRDMDPSALLPKKNAMLLEMEKEPTEEPRPDAPPQPAAEPVEMELAPSAGQRGITLGGETDNAEETKVDGGGKQSDNHDHLDI